MDEAIKAECQNELYCEICGDLIGFSKYTPGLDDKYICYECNQRD